MVSIVFEGFWSKWENLVSPDPDPKKVAKELQRKFDAGEKGGVDIRGAQIRAETAERIRKGRIEPLEAENIRLKQELAKRGVNVGNVTKEEPGIMKKALKTAGEYAPYAAAAGLGLYGLKKYLERRQAQQQQSQQASQYGQAAAGEYQQTY